MNPMKNVNIKHLKRIFKDKLNNKEHPSVLTKEISENICILGLSVETYKPIVRSFSKYLNNENLTTLSLEEIIPYFNGLNERINLFFSESKILVNEINDELFLSKEVFVKKEFIQVKLKKKISLKIKSLEENIIKNMLKMIKQKTKAELINQMLIFFKKFNVFSYFFKKLTKKTIQMLRKENLSKKLSKEEKVRTIWKILRREKQRIFMKSFFKKVEKAFLKKYLKLTTDDLFSFKDKNLKILIKLIIKSKKSEEFLIKISQFIEKEGFSFEEFSIATIKLQQIKRFIKQIKMNEGKRNNFATKIEEFMERFILKNESVHFKEFSDSSKIKENFIFAGIFLRFTSEAEQFINLIKEAFSDELLNNQLEGAQDFIKICKEEGVGNNLIYKLECMVNEALSKKICGRSEITTISSIFWPKFENHEFDFPELQKIKSKFFLEEQKKDSKLKYEFNDLISLCEVDFNGSLLLVTLMQYKIILMLTKTQMTLEEIESYFNTKSFMIHFSPLLENNILYEEMGYFHVTTNPINANVLPIKYTRDSLRLTDEIEKTNHLLLDSCIMKFLKREKRMKIRVLHRKLKDTSLSERLNALAEKGYLKIENEEIIYIP